MTESLLDHSYLPGRWPRKRLRYLALINARKLPEDTPGEMAMRYMDISSVQGDGSVGDAQEMLFQNAPTRARRLAGEGDTAISTVRTYLKAIAYVDRRHGDCVWSTGFAIVSPGPELHPKFLYYVSRSSWFIAEIQRRSVGVSYPAVNADDVGNIACPVPPSEEQSHIVAFLDAEVGRLDELIRLKRLLAALLPERLRAAMHAGVVDLARNARLGYVGTWHSGGTPPKEEAEHWSGSVPWASTKDLGTDELQDTVDHVTDEAARAHSRVVPSGSLLISTRGMALAKRVPLAVTRRAMAFNQDLKALVPTSAVHVDFLRVVIRAYEPELLAAVVESAHGTRRLETHHLKSFRIPLPAGEIQRRVLHEIHGVEAANRTLAIALGDQLRLLSERRDALITAAVTGQLDLASSRGSAVVV